METVQIPTPPTADVAKKLVGKTLWVRLPIRTDFVKCRVTDSPAKGLITITYHDSDAIDHTYMAASYGPRGKDITLTVSLTNIAFALPRE